MFQVMIFHNNMITRDQVIHSFTSSKRRKLQEKLQLKSTGLQTSFDIVRDVILSLYSHRAG